ncbi:hypothetical protein AMTR_s00120p00064670 [Amborella trichopoda]|uniref:Retrotransposon gag domain-containing protein n=1 Tax=Amborella trichopoda TaxID=13333 RepID=W1NT03_AMBTC|nr:hypothetical protein AMTR_s00120p00064670 [Amborella trichopoda]
MGRETLHVTSYLLVVPTLHDKPTALKVMFVHSLIRDSVTWYNNFVLDYTEASYRYMFRKLVTNHRAKKQYPIFLEELVAFKQGPDEMFTDFATRVIERPLSNRAMISMILENANLEYKTFCSHNDVPLTFHIMSNMVILYERTKSQLVGTKPVENQRIRALS